MTTNPYTDVPCSLVSAVRETPPVERTGDVMLRRCDRCGHFESLYDPPPDPDDPLATPVRQAFGPNHHCCRRGDELVPVVWPWAG